MYGDLLPQYSNWACVIAAFNLGNRFRYDFVLIYVTINWLGKARVILFKWPNKKQLRCSPIKGLDKWTVEKVFCILL